MAPGGTLFRFPPHFGENVLPNGSHEWLPYSKNEVRLKSVNNNLPLRRVGPMAAVHKNKYTIPESGLSTHFPVRRTLAFAGGTCYNRFIYF